MDIEEVRTAAAGMMPEVLADLGELVRHPSVAFPGFPAAPVLAAAEATAALFRRAGVAAQLLDIPGGYPAVWAELPAPPGAPTVLLYAHYDVQPAAEATWTSDPWALTERGGRWYGRGAADDKSGIAMHAAALRLFGGRPPVGVKLVVEGEEETRSHLDEYVAAHPRRFAADAMIIADMGNLEVGAPLLTTSLRGAVEVLVTVRTLDHGLHSGEFGGPAPDAMMALVRILDSLVDARGDVAVPGLLSSEWPGTQYDAADFRRHAGMLDGVELIGSHPVASLLWARPTATVLAVDAPAVDKASNTLLPEARAKVSVRIPPGQDPREAARAVEAHVRRVTPWGAHVTVACPHLSGAFAAPTGGPALAAARRALEAAYGAPCDEVGTGGSIPLLGVLQRAAPAAEFLLFGAEDLAEARIHGADESVDARELERMIVAEALTLQYLAEAAGG
ncbi:MAG: M20/M25/M40 family metallo-hydrolase [Thermoleophilia bacterium]